MKFLYPTTLLLCSVSLLVFPTLDVKFLDAEKLPSYEVIAIAGGIGAFCSFICFLGTLEDKDNV